MGWVHFQSQPASIDALHYMQYNSSRCNERLLANWIHDSGRLDYKMESRRCEIMHRLKISLLVNQPPLLVINLSLNRHWAVIEPPLSHHWAVIEPSLSLYTMRSLSAQWARMSVKAKRELITCPTNQGRQPPNQAQGISQEWQPAANRRLQHRSCQLLITMALCNSVFTDPRY